MRGALEWALPFFGKMNIKPLILDKGHYIHKERSYGSFKRSFYVGDIDENQIHGSFKDGMLQLKVPKASEEEKKKNGTQIRLE